MSDFSAVTAAAPGWYPDPQDAEALRYFDGTQWTQHVAPRPIAAPPIMWGSQPLPPSLGVDPSDPVHWMLPTGRTWQSITAGYVALFAIFIWVLGPAALAFGIWALLASNMTSSHGRGRAIFAIIVGVLSSIALLWFIGDLRES
jgi:hypothetical protein